MAKSLITQVLETSDKIKNGRDPRDVLMTLMEEVGELATEIAIVSGHKNRAPGPDGIIGECVDVIAAVVDIIHLMYKDSAWLNEEIEMLLQFRAEEKLTKWERGVRKT
jgi:NTP pyrophosphatase (non-canonical NTP hydrolase)